VLVVTFAEARAEMSSAESQPAGTKRSSLRMEAWPLREKEKDSGYSLPTTHPTKHIINVTGRTRTLASAVRLHLVWPHVRAYAPVEEVALQQEAVDVGVRRGVGQRRPVPQAEGPQELLHELAALLLLEVVRLRGWVRNDV
jgi:hypothetical protein